MSKQALYILYTINNRPISGLATILNFSGAMDFDLGTTNEKHKIKRNTCAHQLETVQLNFHRSGEV